MLSPAGVEEQMVFEKPADALGAERGLGHAYCIVNV